MFYSQVTTHVFEFLQKLNTQLKTLSLVRVYPTKSDVNCQIVNVTSVECGNSNTLKQTCQPQSLGPIPWPGVSELIERQY